LDAGVARFGKQAVMLNYAVKGWRASGAGWLLVGLLSTAGAAAGQRPPVSPDLAQFNLVAQAAARQKAEPGTNPAALAALAVPKAAPVRPKDLPASLSKPVPTSIADLKAIEQQVKSLVAKLSPAVVAVEVGDGSGSGVIISSNGLVLTAGHVAGEPGRRVRFTFPDGRTVRGKTIGVEADSDTGLMQITDRGSWPCVPTGDLRQARVGDWVLAMGHPGGFDLRRSLVVRLGRIIRIEPDTLQTDCTISPGDSGGPLFDMYGRVLATHSFISDSTAANYHVPITQFYDAWASLVEDVKPREPVVQARAYVGATVDDGPGCRLTAIEPNSPASKAGLKVGDIVSKVDGREVIVSASFLRWLTEAEPGETLSLEIKRGDKLLSLDVKLEAPRSQH
jgi:serine protease Do